MSNFFKKNIFAILSLILPLLVYISTLSPTVSYVDSGELKTAAVKLAIAHPTGYPLFTVIGRLFTIIPVTQPSYMLNFMFAVVTSVGCLVFFKFLMLLFQDLFAEFHKHKKKYEVISLATTLTLAWSVTVWDSANHADVFGLQILLMCLLLYIFTKGIFLFRNDDVNSSNTYLLLFAFVLGLSFGNHLSLIFMGIGLIYFYFATFGFSQTSIRRLIVMGIPFLIGLSIYIYLPIRSGNPVSSWGDPGTWENFYRHVSGRQFSVWMFSGSENAKKQFAHFLEMFPKEFFYIPLLIAIPGLFSLFNRSKKIFYFTALLFVFNVLYAINYDIYDIDHYFLLAFVTTSVWVGFGFEFILRKIKNSSPNIVYVLLVIPLITLTQNYPELNKAGDYAVQDYTFNVFKSAPPNSIIYSTQWDFFVAASYYYQFVNGMRPDVAIIDKELLRKSWYLNYVKQHYPEIYHRSYDEFEAYKIELKKFEQNVSRYVNPRTEQDRTDLQKIQITFSDLQNSLVDKNYHDRPFFITFEIDQNQSEQFGQQYFKIPEGLLIRYSKEMESDNDSDKEFVYTIPRKSNYHETFIRNAYASAFLKRANFLINKERFDEAEELIKKTIEIDPENPDSYRLRGVIQRLMSGE